MIRLLRDAMPTEKPALIELDAEIESPVDEVVRRMPAEVGRPLMVVGLEKACPSSQLSHPVLRVLNLSRDEWPERVGRPVVFCVPEYLRELLSREAPDFLDWRSDTIYLPEQDEGALIPIDSRLWDADIFGDSPDQMPPAQRSKRVEELRSRLAGVASSEDPVAVEARQLWLLELVHHLIVLEKLEQAETILANEGQTELSAEDVKGKPFPLIVKLEQAMLARVRCEVARARQLFEEVRGLAVTIGADGLVVKADSGLADCALARDDLKAARGYLEEAIRLNEELSGQEGQSELLGKLAHFYALSGNSAEAFRLYEEVIDEFAHKNRSRERASVLVSFASDVAASGDGVRAQKLYEEAIGLYEGLGDVIRRANTLGQLAGLYRDNGDLRRARALLEEQLEVFDDLELYGYGARSLFELVLVNWLEGDFEAGMERLEESWNRVLRLGDAQNQVFVGSAWGHTLSRQGRCAEAREVLATAEAAARKLGWEAEIEQLARLRAEVDEGAHDRAELQRNSPEELAS